MTFKERLAAIDTAIDIISERHDEIAKDADSNPLREYELEGLCNLQTSLKDTRDYIIKVKSQNSALMMSSVQPVNIIVGDEIVRSILSGSEESNG